MPKFDSSTFSGPIEELLGPFLSIGKMPRINAFRVLLPSPMSAQPIVAVVLDSSRLR